MDNGSISNSSINVGLDAQQTRENDDQPLLIRSLSRNLALADNGSSAAANFNPNRVLNTFFGVFIPVALSQFSTTVFQRLGFVVGQAGLLATLGQFLIGYAILVLTVLSICAISTNGAVEGGGAYYMISRALGPEFGGSIGLLFFLAQIFSCAVYISAFVEGVTDNWGSEGGKVPGHPIPTGQWLSYAYATLVSVFCLIICLIGPKMFAKTSFVTFGILVICIGSVLISYLAQTAMKVQLPCDNRLAYPNASMCSHNNTGEGEWYSGLSSQTFKDNLYSNYTRDYTNLDKDKLLFFDVFAVLFTGITGIMNGANMSGELKNPSKALPKGTLLAVLFTFMTYMTLTFLTAATTSRGLLQGDYNFMKDVSLRPEFVYIGIFAATLSSGLGNMIGGSRILHALSKDDQFWKITRLARITTKGGNPFLSVIICWFLVQLVLLIGNMNAIAPMTTIFFLLSYASTNLACLALDAASAPNFRPTFKYFNIWTCLIGFVCCIIMCFLINVLYASIAIFVAIILVVVLYFRSMNTDWGSISQALIFHQVRKYLLKLDSRKDHVKFWRPQMLYMVSNPRHCANIIDFVNDLKKSGLYVLGHVKLGKLDDFKKDPALTEQSSWLSLVDYLNVKAFVELTLASSVREGLHQLVRLAGLGGMKPNTICLGFYDESEPKDSFVNGSAKKKKRFGFGATDTEENATSLNCFRLVRSSADFRNLDVLEYVNMIRDCIKMDRSVCLFRHFTNLDKETLSRQKTDVDVWPVNIYSPDTSAYVDNCSLYILQLACVLNMVKFWKSCSRIRVFMCHTENEVDAESRKKKLAAILVQLRIKAEIISLKWSKVVDAHYPSELRHQSLLDTPMLPDNYVRGMNELIVEQCNNTSVLFMYLPLPPINQSQSTEYWKQMTTLTENLPPTVLVHGLSPVTSATL